MQLCSLLVLLLLTASPLTAAVPLQDTPNPGAGNAQSPAPVPVEPPSPDAAKQENSVDANKAADEAKKTGDTKKPDEAKPGRPHPDEAKKATSAKGRRGKHGKRGKHSNRVAEANPSAEPRKTVIRHGGALEPTAQIVPGMPREEAMHLRLDTEELLASAGGNLRTLGARGLESQPQETMTQIRDYMEKAQSALKDGDVRRAHTLALKAHLLADDLVKH
jgi:hypothetical protein